MQYSRLKKIEESKNTRQIFYYLGGILFIIIAGFLIGIPFTAKVSSLVLDFKKSGQVIDKQDTTPPPPPIFDPQDQFTNKKTLEISGSSEPGSIITFNINSSPKEIVALDNGKFTFSLDLNQGENSVSAIAKDASGNISKESKVLTIIFDNEPPELTIANQDGQKYYSNQKNITVSGKSEEDAEIRVNDRIAQVGSSGTFSFNYTLSEGENIINVKSTDKAGNIRESSFTAFYFP